MLYSLKYIYYKYLAFWVLRVKRTANFKPENKLAPDTKSLGNGVRACWHSCSSVQRLSCTDLFKHFLMECYLFFSIASEDEEITVHFWNGKEVKVPLGVALWIPPNLWDRIIDMIHLPFTSSLKLMEALQSTSCCNLCCRPLKIPVNAYTLDRCTACRWPCTITWTPFHCHYHSTCCSLAHAQCICYHHPKVSTGWLVPSKSPLLLRDTEQKQPDNSISMKLLELEAPKEEESAVVGADAGAAASSSSSSDSESDSEMYLTKSTMVDSAVNTDSSLFEKSMLKDAVKPQWRYWKRSHPKSLPRSPGRAQFPPGVALNGCCFAEGIPCPWQSGSPFFRVGLTISLTGVTETYLHMCIYASK